jgi:hypothetical protein
MPPTNTASTGHAGTVHVQLPQKFQNQNTQQADDVFAHHTGTGDVFEATDCVINGGGFLQALGAKSITLTRVRSTGAPNKGKTGLYFLVCATNPVQNLVWDNNGVMEEITNGAEAGLRIMGGAGNITVRHVRFRCRKHQMTDDRGNLRVDAHGKPVMDWWKQIQQWRDVRNGLVQGGRTIGPIDVGRQEDQKPGDPVQHVDKLVFVNHQMTHLPHARHPESVGVVELHGCEKIDENGSVIGHWPDGPMHF